MDSLAITDHGVMYGAIEFYQEARKAGIKPIVGCEVYIARESRLSRTPTARTNFHLVLLAKNLTGLPQPHRADDEGAPRGLLLQATHRRRKCWPSTTRG